MQGIFQLVAETVHQALTEWFPGTFHVVFCPAKTPGGHLYYLSDDVCLYLRTPWFIWWRLCVSDDACLYLMTSICIRGRLFVSDDACLYLRTPSCIWWRLSVSDDACLYLRTPVCILRRLFVSADARFYHPWPSNPQYLITLSLCRSCYNQHLINKL